MKRPKQNRLLTPAGLNARPVLYMPYFLQVPFVHDEAGVGGDGAGEEGGVDGVVVEDVVQA